MFFDHRYDRIVPSYDTCFIDCCKIFDEAGITPSHQIVLDAFALLYTVADFAVFSAYGNRSKASKLLSDHTAAKLSSMYHAHLGQILGERIEFYGKVISGMPLHAHCFAGDDLPNQHPVVRCALAFADCCLYPPYIDNYNISTPMLGFVEVTSTTYELFFPLLERLTAFYKEIGDLIR